MWDARAYNNDARACAGPTECVATGSACLRCVAFPIHAVDPFLRFAPPSSICARFPIRFGGFDFPVTMRAIRSQVFVAFVVVGTLGIIKGGG